MRRDLSIISVGFLIFLQLWLTREAILVPFGVQLPTCTYSIGLYSINLNGWNGANATVSIDGNNVLTNQTLGIGLPSAFYNFDVTNTSVISTTYNSGTNDSGNTYSIFTGSSGAGYNIYNSLPLLYTMPNGCGSTCTYSVMLMYISGDTGPNYLTVYINGLAVIENLSLPTVTNKTASFNVKSGDLIQFGFYFVYKGDELGYGYQVFATSDATGSPLYTFQNNPNGPNPSANIPDFCSQTMSLAITSTSITNSSVPYIGSSAVIEVTPSILTTNPVQIFTVLNCGKYSVSQFLLSSTSVTFPIPSGFSGNCYFSAISNDHTIPQSSQSPPFNFILGYPSSFASPSDGATYTADQSIPVLIITDNPVPQVMIVLLRCGGGKDGPVTTQSFNVTTGSTTLLQPLISGTCTLSVPIPPSNTQAPPAISIAIKVSVSIVVPASSPTLVVPAGSSTPVTIAYDPASTTPGVVLITLTCDESEIAQILMGLSMNFSIPLGFRGDCVFQIKSKDYVATNTVTITVVPTSTLSFSLPVAYSAYPSPTPIPTLVIVDMVPTFQVNITAQLLCESSTSPYSVSLTTAVTKNVTYPSNLYGQCKMSLPSLPSYLIAPYPVNFTIFPSLTVVSPTQSTSLIYGQAVSLLVTTNDPAGAQYTASFSCSTGVFQITGLIAGVPYKIVPTGIYGNAIITVTATNLSPASLSFTIMKPTANFPPVKLPYFSAIYAHMKDENNIVILGMKQINTDPFMD